MMSHTSNLIRILLVVLTGVGATSIGCYRRAQPPPIAPTGNVPPAVTSTPGPTWLPVEHPEQLFRVDFKEGESLSLIELAQRQGATAELDREVLYLLGDDGLEFAPSEFATTTGPGLRDQTSVYVHFSPASSQILQTWTVKYVRSYILVCVDGKARHMVALQTPVATLAVSCPTQADADEVASILKSAPVQVWHSAAPGQRPDESALRAELHNHADGH